MFISRNLKIMGFDGSVTPQILRFVPATRLNFKHLHPKNAGHRPDFPESVKHTLDLILCGSAQHRAFNLPRITCCPHQRERPVSMAREKAPENVESVSGLLMFESECREPA